MCGGITYDVEKIPEDELKKFYTIEQIKLFKKNKMISSFFWDKKPILPIKENNNITLFEWGNRDKNIKLPKTGWAKNESIERGKWKYLNPKKVKIPATKGYEKQVWFDLKGDIEGILVEKNDTKRVYMVTKEADINYLKKTKHNRMPKADIEFNSK